MSEEPPRPDRPLCERDLAPGWVEQFGRWLQESRDAGIAEPEAMVLASADAHGRPSARSVLLKGFDVGGFVFFTNYGSRKARELAENPRGALLFPWYALGRQVLAEGEVSKLDSSASDEYFATRDYASQIGAHASRQSSVIADRAALEQARAEAEARLPPQQPVPRPSWWGGFRLEPIGVEFWQGRAGRLHDRLRYRRSGREPQAWLIERLSP